MLEIIFSRNEASNEGQLLSIKSIDRMDPKSAVIQLNLLISQIADVRKFVKYDRFNCINYTNHIFELWLKSVHFKNKWSPLIYATQWKHSWLCTVYSHRSTKSIDLCIWCWCVAWTSLVFFSFFHFHFHFFFSKH